MAYIDAFGEDSRPALLRWMGCAAIVLALHGIVGFALTRQPSEVEDDSGAPVVTIELMPMSVAPSAPPTALAPGPQETQPESEARPSEEVRHEEKQPEEKKVEVTPAPEPMLTLPPLTPEEAKKPEEPKEAQPEPKPEAPVPTAPPRAVAPAERPAAPAVGRVAQRTPAAIASWQRQLMAHLERHKRFQVGPAPGERAADRGRIATAAGRGNELSAAVPGGQHAREQRPIPRCIDDHAELAMQFGGELVGVAHHDHLAGWIVTEQPCHIGNRDTD